MSERGRVVTGASLFAVAAAVVGWRIWRRLDATTPPFAPEAALVDFRDAVYYPVVALLDGANPYDRAVMLAQYPVNGTIGLYSPSTLLLHLPWGLLPYRAAELGFVVWSLALVLVLAMVAWRIAGARPDAGLVLGLAGVLVVSRPGHWNLFLGQVALETGLATLAALWWGRTRPALGGLGLAVATFKATYGVPLVLLMAARREWRALGIGLAVGAMLTVGPALVLVSRVGLDGLGGGLLANYESRVTTPRMSAAASTFRVDVVALVARSIRAVPGFLATAALGGAVLAIAALALRRLGARGDERSRRQGLAIAALAIILCTYHQQYDLVLLAPLLAMAWPLTPFRRAQLPALLVALPFVNYLASGGMQRASGWSDAVVLLPSSLNVVVLLAAFALLVRDAFRAEAR